ncbi:MAG: hypothetical protein RIQ75_876, partial [Pseudomonadota bacterium]
MSEPSPVTARPTTARPTTARIEYIAPGDLTPY